MKDVKATRAQQISSDHLLGALGCSLAVAAASFGVYMAIHGPAATSAGHDFTIFAQLAPRAEPASKVHVPSKSADDLDMSATASIPKPQSAGAVSAIAADAGTAPAGPVLRGIVLQAADTEAAEVAIDGRMEKVRVGDTIPGAGEVLAIFPGRRPMLKTSLGVIVSAR